MCVASGYVRVCNRVVNITDTERERESHTQQYTKLNCVVIYCKYTIHTHWPRSRRHIGRNESVQPALMLRSCCVRCPKCECQSANTCAEPSDLSTEREFVAMQQMGILLLFAYASGLWGGWCKSIVTYFFLSFFEVEFELYLSCKFSELFVLLNTKLNNLFMVVLN